MPTETTQSKSTNERQLWVEPSMILLTVDQTSSEPNHGPDTVHLPVYADCTRS